MVRAGSKSNDKRVALIGANKDALALLPVIFGDPATRLVMVVDPNPDAMLFKLMELGYRIASRHMVSISTDLEEIKKIKDLDVIITALKDPATERFLSDNALAGVEKLSPMSAKLLWSVRGASKDLDDTALVEKIKPSPGSHSTILTPLRDIVDAVRLTHDRDELLTDILDIAIETTRAETGSVMLISKENGKSVLLMEVARGMDEEVIRKVRVPLGEGVSGKVARDGEPRIISGAAKDTDFSRPQPRQRMRGARRQVKSAISVPLIVGVNIIGVINVNSSESNHVFIDEDLNLLTTLAGLAAEVIQKSSEHDRLKLDAAKFSLWKTLELNMSERKPLHKRLVMVCRHLAELVSGLTCFVYLYDDEKKKLTLNASSLKESPAAGHLNFAYGEGIEGYLVGAMKDVILVDRSFDSGDGSKRVYMALPMAVRDDVVGVFVAHIVSPQGLSKYNESFLKEMSMLLGESIHTHKNNEDDLARSRSIVKVDEMGLELIAMKDSKRLLSIIATAASEILGAEGVVLKLMKGVKDNFERVASHGLENKRAAEQFSAIEEETTREVFRKGEFVLREFSEDTSPYVRGIISYPLSYSGEVIGILSLFNKLDNESPYPRAFGATDIETLKRFIVYVERVLPTITEKYVMKNGAMIATHELFRRRFEEEMKRAKRYGREVVIVTVRVGGLAGVSGNGKEEFIKKLLGYINDKVRAFDVVTMLNEETIGILFPETDTRVLSALNKTILGEAPTEFSRGIFYGVASYPKDGDDFDKLIGEALGQVTPGKRQTQA